MKYVAVVVFLGVVLSSTLVSASYWDDDGDADQRGREDNVFQEEELYE